MEVEIAATGVAGRWREAFRDRRFVMQAVGVTAALVAILSGFARFRALR